MQLGYVGLGAMGGALARRLMRVHELRVFDRRAGVVAEFAENGAIAMENGAALAHASDIVLLCLPRSSDVREAIFGANGLADGLMPGKIVIDQTTGDPDETRAMAIELAETGATLIDAPVSGGPRGADAGTIAVMAGGPVNVFDTVKPVLETISPNVFHCGDTGNGHVMKLVNNTISASCRIATLEAVAMGRKYGLSLENMTEVLNEGSARNRTTEIMLPNMVAGTQSSNFAMNLMVKDLTLATKLGGNCGAPMLIANMTRGLLHAGINRFGGDANMDEAATLIESLADTTLRD